MVGCLKTVKAKGLKVHTFLALCALKGWIESKKGCLRFKKYQVFQSVIPTRGHIAPIAQLDRVTDYESVGRVFESPWAHHE